MPKGQATKTSGKYFDKLVEFNKNKSFPNEMVFVENSTYPRQGIKKRLIKGNMIPYKCDECGIDDNWNDKKLVLQLDHINGINNDNRIENLRFLCPNCHTQQDTYGAKNRLNDQRQPKKYYNYKSVA